MLHSVWEQKEAGNKIYIFKALLVYIMTTDCLLVCCTPLRILYHICASNYYFHFIHN